MKGEEFVRLADLKSERLISMIGQTQTRNGERLRPTSSVRRLDQLIIDENTSTDGKPSAKRHLDCFARSVSISDFAPQPAARGKSFLLILQLAVHDETFAGKPTILHPNLVAFVIEVPIFHIC